MKARSVNLVCGDRLLGGVSIKQEIFRGGLTVIFVLFYAIKGDIPMSESAFHFPRNAKRVNDLLFMDGLKLYTKNERGWDSLVQTVYIFSVD